MDEDDNVSLRAFVTDRLGRGIAVSDRRFDEVFSTDWRAPSARFWTPVAVALRVASWFSEHGSRRVLDIGSGAGKMCIVGALSSDIEFIGIEHREPLVREARSVAETLGVEERTTFLHGSIDTLDVSAYDSFYLYNPFWENVYSTGERLDSNVELTEARYRRDTRTVERILRAAPIGARIITYHGFGGRMPNSYAPVKTLRIASDALRLWVKRRRESTGYYIEMGYTGLALDMTPTEGPGPSDVSTR